LIKIYRTQVRNIQQQPQTINNIFGIVPNEKILHQYRSETGCCGCGSTYTITLTDARLIQRQEDCACCGTNPHVDQMLFLSDISSITDFVAGRCFSPCSCCCSSSCCTSAKQIGFVGPSGTLVFTFNINDIQNALVQIPAAAMPHKTSQPKHSSSVF
jgi:hypothetical protein